MLCYLAPVYGTDPTEYTLGIFSCHLHLVLIVSYGHLMCNVRYQPCQLREGSFLEIAELGCKRAIRVELASKPTDQPHVANSNLFHTWRLLVLFLQCRLCRWSAPSKQQLILVSSDQ
jgi:hypothetical protein